MWKPADLASRLLFLLEILSRWYRPISILEVPPNLVDFQPFVFLQIFPDAIISLFCFESFRMQLNLFCCESFSPLFRLAFKASQSSVELQLEEISDKMLRFPPIAKKRSTAHPQSRAFDFIERFRFWSPKNIRFTQNFYLFVILQEFFLTNFR